MSRTAALAAVVLAVAALAGVVALAWGDVAERIRRRREWHTGLPDVPADPLGQIREHVLRSAGTRLESCPLDRPDNDTGPKEGPDAARDF